MQFTHKWLPGEIKYFKGTILSRAPVFHGISGCVTPLCFQNNEQQAASLELRAMSRIQVLPANSCLKYKSPAPWREGCLIAACCLAYNKKLYYILLPATIKKALVETKTVHEKIHYYLHFKTAMKCKTAHCM